MTWETRRGNAMKQRSDDVRDNGIVRDSERSDFRQQYHLRVDTRARGVRDGGRCALIVN